MANKSPSYAFFLLLSCWLNIMPVHASLPWQTLSPGIDYQQISPSQLSPFALLHIFKLDLKHTSLTFCPKSTPLSTVKQSALKNHALITLNSGFFSPEYTPLGLRVKDGKQLSPIKPISWWGIFYIKHNRAHIVNYKRFHQSPHVSFAIQAGPRLIINNKIPKLRPGLAERTALGITRNGELIIVATEHTSMSTTLLAQIMRDKLNCSYALNLDGGSSTQLFAQIGQFKRQVLGFSKIPDPLCVYTK